MRVTAVALGIFLSSQISRAQPRPTSGGAQPSAAPHRTEPPEDEALVRAQRPVSAASDDEVRQRDLELRPRTRPADLFEVAPGLLVVQHAGGGKANQYFLRGFDADHGTDVSLMVDGVPINNVSHGHGQGYSDPHFIIPELVDRVDVHAGPYHAEDGDFATAGSVNLRYRDRVRESSLNLQGGMFGTARFLGILRAGVGPVHGYIAGELYRTDGPFTNPLGYERFNGVGRWTWAPSERTRLGLTLMAYGGAWNASGQVPSRLTDDPRSGFSRFDSVDPTEGGQSSRRSLTFQLAHDFTPTSRLELSLYAVQYRLSIFSNFTFFAADPERGDMIEQTDDRVFVGLRAVWRRLDRAGAWRFRTTIGMQARADDIENGLHHSPGRLRAETVGTFSIRESSLGFFAEEEVSPTRWLRVMLGGRVDLFDFSVEDTRSMPDPQSSGVRQASIANPKLSVIVSPWRWLDLFANGGGGFHSNDARGVVRRIAPVTPLTRAWGYEVGARARIARRLDLAFSAWGMDLASELVWVGDEGTTEARGPTRRLGLTGEVRWAITPWLRFDADVSVVDATYVNNAGNANAVALAPTLVASAGLSVRHPVGVFGSIRLRAVADRPATEDRSLQAQGFAIVNAQVGYRWRRLEFAVQVENLFDSEWREAQFASGTRLRNECLTAGSPGCNPPTDGARFGTIDDIHFTPGTPFSLQGRVSVYLPE